MQLEYSQAGQYKCVRAVQYFEQHGARFAVHRSLHLDSAWAVTETEHGITIVDGITTQAGAQSLASRLLRAEDVALWREAVARMTRH